TIHMQVSPEVSSLDPSAGISVSGFVVPGLRSRRSQTVLEMKNGDNFVLSGLYNDDMTDDSFKTPLLGQIPILGALFRSQQYQRNQTEMIIVIHPEIQNDLNDMSATKAASVPVTPITASEIQQTAQMTPEQLAKLYRSPQDSLILQDQIQKNSKETSESAKG